MILHLYYHGNISTTRHTLQKFKYRRSFLKQLQCVKAFHEENEVPPEHTFSPEKMRFVDEFCFLPLVTKDCRKVVDLDITLLSHSEPSCNKNYPTGDTDNLLKALIDGLRMAQNKNETRDEKPHEDETPFLCLLEDDQMIQRINIVHDRLFFSSRAPSEKEIVALIKVTIKPKWEFLPHPSSTRAITKPCEEES